MISDEYPYLSSALNGRSVPERRKKPSLINRSKYYASDELEMCRLMLEHGLDIHKQDLVVVTGRSQQYWAKHHKNQRTVLERLVGAERLAFAEGLILGWLRQEYEELRAQEDLPPDWDETWEKMLAASEEQEPIEGSNHHNKVKFDGEG